MEASNININLLKTFIMLYVNQNISSSVNKEILNQFLKEAFVVDNYLNGINIFESNKVDIIIFEIDSLDLEEVEFLETIRLKNKTIPIIVIVSEINKKMLNLSLELSITMFLLKPLKIQELCRAALFHIQKYKRKEKMRLSVKTLGDYAMQLKHDNEEMAELNQYLLGKIKFNEQLHTKYLNHLRVNKNGQIDSFSGPLFRSIINGEIIGMGLNKLFIETSLLQKAMLVSIKERKIQSIEKITLTISEFEHIVIIVPNFDKKHLFYGYELHII